VRLLEQPISTNNVPRAFFPRVAIGCRLSLKIDRNLEGPLSVATWDDEAWIRGMASGTLYRSVMRTRLREALHTVRPLILATLNFCVWFNLIILDLCFLLHRNATVFKFLQPVIFANWRGSQNLQNKGHAKKRVLQ